jgi:hypothetical protein
MVVELPHDRSDQETIIKYFVDKGLRVQEVIRDE